MGDRTPEPSAQTRRAKVVFYSFLVMLCFILFLAFLVFRHFLITTAVAASVAALLGPIYDRLTRVLRGRRSVSAAILVAVTVMVILIPLLTYAILLKNQAVGFYEWIGPRLEPETLGRLWSEELPARYAWLESLKQTLQRAGLDQERLLPIVSPALSQLAAGANQGIQRALTGLTSALLYLILFLLTLFFILRDGESLATTLRAVAPVSNAQAEEIYDRLTRTVKAVLYAMVVVPLAQGLLAMIGFRLFGLPSPIFWGTMLIFAAVIPGIGSPLVWLPAAVYLLLTAPLWQGIGMLLYGTLVISTSDNVIKPMLLHETANIHPLLAFFSILGGILSFGLIGFLIGPVILSLVLSAIRIYRIDILGGSEGTSALPPAKESAAE
jgi:predicted PurR-regulated permease PerM